MCQGTPKSHDFGYRHFLFTVLLLALLSGAGTQRLYAQTYSTVPGPDYDAALAIYYSGEYASALQAFQSVASGGVRTTDGRWIDSICYFTMAGECHYQLGQLPQALAQYEAALKLYLVHSNWMLTVDFPPTISASTVAPGTRITWGVSRRRTVFADYPDSMLSFQGQINITSAVRNGGVVRPAQFYPVRAQEVVRCTSLALRRRREIMGPACVHAPLTAQLLAVLERRPAPPNHWSQAWANVQLGLAYAAAEKIPQATVALRTSLQAAGQFEHLLTCTALLELGKLALASRSYDLATMYFLEATYSAAVFGQFNVMEEAFRFGLITHLVTASKGPYPPLANATAWADKNGSPVLEASLLLLTAESFAALGQPAPAATAVSGAQRLVARSEMSASQISARLQFQTAQVAYLQGKIAAGDTALAAALKLRRAASTRLFQIALVDGWFANGAVSPRLASELFDLLLREPAAADWTLDPLETLAYVGAPIAVPLEHWFLHELLERKDLDKALEIADRIRRRRFHTSLPDGGRLLALRWILGAPREALSDVASIQRNDLNVKYAAFRGLAAESDATRAALARLPLVPEDDVESAQQRKLFKQLAAVSTAQEAILRTMALQREPSEFVFPPLRPTDKIRKALGDRRLALVFLATSQYLFGFAVTREKVDVWRVQDPGKVRQQAVELLKAIGLRDRNQALGEDQLRDESWKKPARELLEELSGDSTGKVWDEYDEVVVVPDGMLWYVPFELLQAPTRKGSVSLIARLRVRYAPTLALAVPDARGHKRTGNTAVVTGRMYPRDGDEPTATAYEQIATVLPRTARLARPLPVPSGLFASVCDRLVVLDDIDEQASGVYNWSPMQIDRSKPGSALGNWFSFPFGGPDQVVLPGFHSIAENGLRDGGNGGELFLSVCGLMSTGVRTVLLSRWRVAGRSSHELVREFVQELPHTSASAAWQRSVYLLMHDDLDIDREPRVQVRPLEKSLSAAHPFFWSGYLLADTGSEPLRDDVAPAAEKPALPAAALPAPPAALPSAEKPVAPDGAKPAAAGKPATPTAPVGRPGASAPSRTRP